MEAWKGLNHVSDASNGEYRISTRCCVRVELGVVQPILVVRFQEYCILQMRQLPFLRLVTSRTHPGSTSGMGRV
jgi:hypothetical protein